MCIRDSPFWYRPIDDAKGMKIKFMAKQEAAVTFAENPGKKVGARVKLAELPLPRLSAFTNGWAATEKAAKFPSSNLPVVITTSLDPLSFYEKYQISFEH